jgi:hypothetical protein
LSFRLIVLLAALLVQACVANDGASEAAFAPAAAAADGVVSDDVSAADAARVRALAEGRSDFVAAQRAGRVVFVGVERLRLKDVSPETVEAQELIRYRSIHYRYADNTTVYSTVDLDAGRVLDTEEVVNARTALAAEEIARARELALSDPQVRRALGGRIGRVAVEALPIYAPARGDSLYGRRAVALLFKDGDYYVANLQVIVDLTGETVSVTRTAPADREH